MKRLRRRSLPLLVSMVAAWPAASHAVRLADDGLGQALIYPYYTVQQANGDSYNTYLSIVNHTADAKALRVRFREGRASRETFSLNLYLGPHDTWTAAIVPDDSTPARDPARVITDDISCTSPALPPSGSPFQNTAYSGTNDDGNGAGLDRAREGFIEVIEMATLTGAAAAAVTASNTGVPADCGAVQGGGALQVAAPSGGLSGTVTLINVQSGLDFDLNAVALADLSTKPFYRPPNDPYPDLNAAEIDRVSLVVANGAAYRATWSRPVDAVSAVLMHDNVIGEYVLDDATDSNTDLVETFPTREFYVTPTSAALPFSHASVWADHCRQTDIAVNELAIAVVANREASTMTVAGSDFPELPATYPNTLCASSVVIDVANGSPHTELLPQTRVLGSLTRGFGQDGLAIHVGFDNGWLRMFFSGPGPTQAGLTSLADSTRMDLATGAVTTAPQTYYGLPVIGFTARTFVNGTLQCSAGACQGNYGGAFPFQYTRKISP